VKITCCGVLWYTFSSDLRFAILSFHVIAIMLIVHPRTQHPPCPPRNVPPRPRRDDCNGFNCSAFTIVTFTVYFSTCNVPRTPYHHGYHAIVDVLSANTDSTINLQLHFVRPRLDCINAAFFISHRCNVSPRPRPRPPPRPVPPFHQCFVP